MAYGLQCFDAGGYLAFDSSVMDDFLKVTASGEVSLAAGVTSANIIAVAVDYIYVYEAPTPSLTSPVVDNYEILNRITDGFKIKNTATSSQVFFYVAFTR